MSWIVLLSVGILLLFALLLAGVPIFISFLVLNVVGIFHLLGPSGFGMFANSIFTTGTLNALCAHAGYTKLAEVRASAML
jgi:hypothetical protein